MEENLRVIIFGLLVTLSSVRGGRFTFSADAYIAALDMERNNGVDIENIKSSLRPVFSHGHMEHAWVVETRNPLRGLTPTKMLVPFNPYEMTTLIYETNNLGQCTGTGHLSYMLMSFDKVNYNIGDCSSGQYDGNAESLTTTYGKLIVCFQDRTSGKPETCFHMIMFAPPEERNDIKFALRYAKTINPISNDAMDRLTQGNPFMWSLSTLDIALQLCKRASLNLSRRTNLSVYTDLILHLYTGQSSYYLHPIIVEENLFTRYYTWVTGDP